MNTEAALQSLGLTQKESAVYLATLQLGRVSAYSIAEKSGLKKPTTYVILEQLLEKGLVKRVPKTKKQLYMAEDPNKFVLLAEANLAEAKKLMPELQALKRTSTTKVNVMYFEGELGVKHMFTHRMKEMKGKEMAGFFAYPVKKWSPAISDFMTRGLFEQMKSEGITMRGVAPEHKSLAFYRNTDSTYNREVKTLPFSAYSSKVSIDVLGDMTRIYDYEKSQGILIENQSVANTIKQIFELVWKQK